MSGEEHSDVTTPKSGSGSLLRRLAIVQAVLLAALLIVHVARGEGRRASTPEVGGRVNITVLDSVGNQMRLHEVVSAHGDPVLLLTAYSHCAWCDSVSQEWAAFASTAEIPVYLFGREPVDSIVGYRESRAIPAGVLSVAHAPEGTTERAMAGRTPWLFLVDENSRLLYSGHGSELSQIDSLLKLLSATP